MRRRGCRILRPVLQFKVEGTPLERIDFASLMIALFFGIAALPHILIRYYKVPSSAAARGITALIVVSLLTPAGAKHAGEPAVEAEPAAPL